MIDSSWSVWKKKKKKVELELCWSKKKDMEEENPWVFQAE